MSKSVKTITRVVAGIGTGGLSEVTGLGKKAGDLAQDAVGSVSGGGVNGNSPSSSVSELPTTKAQADELDAQGQERQRKARQAQTLLTGRAQRDASVSTLTPRLSGRATLG